ncbi:MAG: hypothetical protein LBU03_03000 [Tannerellaceae bacterium]|jgi:hypothetical protein|nr:hypothetical protein [Tannerellaceae bacterium]
MEKIWKLVWLSVVALPFMFTECSSYPLAGTEWINEDEGFRKLTFEEKEFSYYGDKVHSIGAYSYDPPFITFITIHEGTQQIEKLLGTVKGKELKFGEIIYIKK